MDYTELCDKVKAALPEGTCFYVGVETWHNYQGTKSELCWQVYLDEQSKFYRGHSAQEAFDAFAIEHAPLSTVSPKEVEAVAGSAPLETLWSRMGDEERKAIIVEALTPGKLDRTQLTALVELCLNGADSISAKDAFTIGTRLTDMTGIDPEITESLAFWYSRQHDANDSAQRYQVWLTGAMEDKSVADIMAELTKLAPDPDPVDDSLSDRNRTMP